MNNPNIPMNAYIFIGVASLVLAFVTVLDNQPAESESSTESQDTSFTDYLPSFNGTNDNAAAAETVEQASDYQAPPEPVAQSQNYDMFNTNMNSDQGLAQNEYQAPYEQPPQQIPQQQNYDMFNTNMNSDQGLAQNENFGYQQPYGQPQQQGQQPQPVNNPFYGGRNKTGKRNDKGKKNKKTKCYKGK